MEKKSLIEELHDIQDKEKNKNYIPREEAEKCTSPGTPASKVYGVATFYTMFSVKPRGRHIIRVCRNLSCHLEGAENIADKLKEILGIGFDSTTPDGMFTLEESSCLGMCSVSPAMTVDDVPFGNLHPGDIESILKKIRAGEKK